MSKVTIIPMVYLIDDRPGEEFAMAVNVKEAVEHSKKILPHLREVEKAEYDAFRAQMDEGEVVQD